MRIVDAHHHLWDLEKHYYPWLSDKILPVSYGDYKPIRRTYSLADYKADIGDLPVAKSVHVQAGIDPADPVAETAWVQAQSMKSSAAGLLGAIVAYVDLSAEDACLVVERHLEWDNVRGVRQMLHAGAATAFLESPIWQRNLSALSRYGLSFDLQIYPRQIPHALRVIDANPAISFILDHAGCPLRDDADWLKRWQDGLVALAQRPNVSVKLSGFGMFERNWTVDSIRPLVQHVIEHFGVERCLFCSNYPVDALMASYRTIWDAYFDVCEGCTASEMDMLFSKNAERLYRF